MNEKRNFWVIGGDLRQAHLAQLLALDGHEVHTLALEQGAHAAPLAACKTTPEGMELAQCVIFPLPVVSTPGQLNAPLSDREHPLSSLLPHLRPTQLLCGGKCDPNTALFLHRNGLYLHDYFAREELVVANAVPTAEGAVQIAMEELPVTLHGASVLVLGFGRVGTLTAHRFGALGARVSVAARSCAQRAWAQAFGFSAVHPRQLSGCIGDFDLVVNTIPSLLLGEELLSLLQEDALVIDLASRPGGVDMEAAARLGRRVIWALSLPGKVAPLTAAACLRDTIYNLFQEAGN
ncbi:MAG: dipicolinate synthase subunit DpsA [Oscillospiraceae bacterium]|nr:dipicolinate synthase subunit DpsA [Oscillospiraceae bacterium]